MMARILVVDDDALFAALMRRALEQNDHYVAAVGEVAAAREAMQRETFDALVCDMVLPGESGLRLLREVRATNPNLALIAISGGMSAGRSVHVDVLQLAQSLGTDAVVKKPFDLQRFTSTVEGVILKKRHEGMISAGFVGHPPPAALTP